MLNVKKITQAAAIFLALLALVFVSAVVTMKVVTFGRTVQVPDVSGKELTDAINTLKEAGLEIKVDREEFHPTSPEGTVISQTPAPGSSVKKGRNISVVVSLGRQEIIVPDLYGESFRRAQIVLKQSGLSLGEVARVASEEPRDSVIAQDPAAQQIIQRGGMVDLLVCNGPAPARYLTPDLTGKNLAAATEIVRRLEVGLTATGKSGVVTSQDPLAGYPVTAGDTIKVTLGSAAPAAAPAPPAGKPGTAPARKPGNAPAQAPATAPQPKPAQPAAPVQKPAPATAPAAPVPAPRPEQSTAPAQKPARQPARQIIRDPLGGKN